MKKPDQSKSVNVALLVHTCDRYQLLYRGFEQFFHNHWDFDIRCNYYFATEEADVHISGFKTIKSGPGQWSDRLMHLLQHEISEDYVIYLQEDVWFTEDISARFFNELFELVFEKNYKQVKLHSSDIYKTIATNDFVSGFNITKIDNKNSRYLMSHQVTLWDREFLMNNLKTNENPWQNERRATKRLKATNPDIYHADYFAQNFSPPINQNLPGVRRSNFHTVSLNGALNSEFMEFVPRLARISLNDQEYAEKLIFHYQNGLTHDGRQKPRKDDIFKRTKKLFLKLWT